jgi:hypothetical protein
LASEEESFKIQQLEAIDSFDSSFKQKKFYQLEFTKMPEPIVVPEMKVRDFKSEVQQIKREFNDKFDCSMENSS